jgi:HAD superfamily phosphoserine phosphatase-like hydrolase
MTLPPTGEALLPEAVMQLAPGPDTLALFDADGTLWRGDICEDFTRWMIAARHFDARHWASYERLNAIDSAAACFHILAHFRGKSPAEIDERAHEFWTSAGERRWIGATTSAMAWLRARGVRTYVVSGTAQPVLEPLRSVLPADDILGLELELGADGLYTGRAAGIPSVGASKVARVRSVSDRPVCVAAGNSILDAAMLGTASLAWAVHPDAELLRLAQVSRWLITEAT